MEADKLSSSSKGHMELEEEKCEQWSHAGETDDSEDLEQKACLCVYGYV